MTDQPTIVITGSPAWATALPAAASTDYRFIALPHRTGYVARLADLRAALVLVDGDAADWRFWCTTPKVSPATRRIPVVVVAHDDAVHQAALQAGADATLLPESLLQHPAEHLAPLMVLPSTADREQLACDCQLPLPPLAAQAVAQFNNRAFYPQHDLFEAQWMQTESPVRDLYRAVLQVGVAYYQVERGNPRGALKMLLRAVQWLERLPDVCQTIDVRQLRADAYAVRATLEAGEPVAPAQLKPLKIVAHDG